MKTFYYFLLIAILLIYKTITAIASPAYPGIVKMKQPDGDTISLYLKGDEKIHWMESEDGYTLLYDNNQAIVYAISDNQGGMTPSSIKAKDISSRTVSERNFLKDMPKELFYSKTQINTLKSIWEIGQNYLNDDEKKLFRAAIGEARGICALIEFPDKPLVKTKDDFNILMNQSGYSASGAKGSVNDYYLENSYGKLNLVITVAGPYTVSKNWAYYGENGTDGSDIPERLQEFAKEAAQLAFTDSIINPADYDIDNDGYIDSFHIIYAGYGEESGGGNNSNSIWAHKYGFPSIMFGNKRLNAYSCSPELRGNSGSNITNIGVICHEMCHIFGAPDFYDVDGSASGGDFIGTGQWDLMANGSWNNNGISPAHINMYQKIQFGWVNPVILDEPNIISDMPNSVMNPVAYRYNTSVSGEYYILENRQRVGFDQYIPGTGLLIYHVSITNSDIYNNSVNIRHPQKVYPVCASATTNPTGTVASYGIISSAGCPFPGTSKKTSFSDYTIPSATSWNGTNTLKSITEIQEQAGLISFRFMMSDAEPVLNFQVRVENENNVSLSWNKPSDDVTSYNVYRNDQLLIKLMGKNSTSYSQSNLNPGNYNYCVTAFYNTKESSPVCKEVIIINSSIDSNAPTVQNLEAQNINDDKDIELTWQSPFVSGWVTHANDFDTCLYYRGLNKIIPTIKFTLEDLRNFTGSKLTKVLFWIENPLCTHTIHIWLTDKGFLPGNPIISQTVDNPTRGIAEITLDSPVSCESNKELWIGIESKYEPITYIAGIDRGPGILDRNWVLNGNQWNNLNGKNDFNWFISGYLQFDSDFLNAPEDTWLRSSTATATNYVIYRNDQKIATTNQPYYVDVQPEYGNHIYCVSIAYDNEKESETVCVDAVSSNNTSIEIINTLEEAINIYPNPIKKGETLVIHCDYASTLSLFSITGQLLQQEKIDDTVFHKKMDFKPGIYLLQIKNDSKTFIRKIIIK